MSKREDNSKICKLFAGVGYYIAMTLTSVHKYETRKKKNKCMARGICRSTYSSH